MSISCGALGGVVSRRSQPTPLHRRPATAAGDRPVVRMTRRQVIVFARAPALGTGKRRLARDIGDLAALRFERLMLARLLRRLGRACRWHLRRDLTPDHEA